LSNAFAFQVVLFAHFTRRDREVMQCGHALDAAALMKPASEDVLQVCSVLRRMNSSNTERAECGQSGQF